MHRRLGLDQLFTQSGTIPFAVLKQQHWLLTPSPLLPKQWQLLPSFLKMPMLSFGERLKTALLLKRLAGDRLPDITIADWFTQHKVSQNALDAFWLPLLLSTLSEMPEYAAAKALQKVIRNAFLTGREGMTIHMPKVPLRTIYHEAAAKALAVKGVSLHFFKRLRRLHWEQTDADRLPAIRALEFSDGTFERTDRYILALPAFQLWKVLEASDLTVCAEQLGLERFEPGAITTVHLWLDHPLLKSGNRYCALSGGIGQFLCAPHDIENYYTVVISAAHRLLSDSEMMMSGSGGLANRILEQLRTTFAMPALQLVHHRTTTCFEAVFSPKPDIYEQRPASAGLFANGVIAGDWTQTGFPATMEGAVRSGLTAVKDIAADRARNVS